MKESKEHHPVVKVIQFNEDYLNVIAKDGEFYIAMKPVCEALGLDWDNHRRIIEHDPVLNSTTVMIRVVAGDGKNREMVCLPLDYFHGWLFKIDLTRYEGPRLDKLIDYQRRCYQDLREALMPRLSPMTLAMKLNIFLNDVVVAGYCNQATLKEYCWLRTLGLTQGMAGAACNIRTISQLQAIDRRLKRIGVTFPNLQYATRRKMMDANFEKLFSGANLAAIDRIVQAEVADEQ